MINGRTRLHVVANGTMTGQRYIDEVLLPHVRLFRGAVGDKFVYGRQRNMSSNTRCSGLSRQRGQVAGRNYPPTNKNTLFRALTKEWDKLPQQLLDNVVQKNFGGRDANVKFTFEWGNKKYFSAVSDAALNPSKVFEFLGESEKASRLLSRKNDDVYKRYHSTFGGKDSVSLYFSEPKNERCAKFPWANREGAKLELHTDACKLGLGAVLLQQGEDGRLSIHYMSKKTSIQEEKLCSYELEVLAVIEALKKFRNTYWEEIPNSNGLMQHLRKNSTRMELTPKDG
ncbi:transposon Tf2-9 polyprotein [Trichonephila clavipes]|nr:transposon Tf2-9 polyprotein [Trichonephila clavipes]